MPPNRSIREKCHRLPRENYRGLVTVAFTASIDDSHPTFRDSAVVSAFLPLLTAATTKFACIVPVYCFMPEHLHVIMRGRDESADTWAAMVALKQLSGYWLGQNRSADRWQKDFFDHVVRADEDLHAQVRYVADNPVRRGLVRVWWEYPYTGAIGVDLRQLLAEIAVDASAKDSRRSP